MTAVFTVVIPTYNRADFLGRAIRSVFQQTFEGWKLLIIDDASTDGTKEAVEPYLNHPNVQYHRMERNVGISGVMNQALSLVDTPYLVQLDSDDWLEQKALATLHRYIRKDNGKTALFYGNINVWRVTEKMKYRKTRLVRHRQFATKYHFLMYNSWMVAPRCYLVRALREAGGWDTSDEFGGRIMEDRRMILRLIETHPVKWIDKTLYNRTKHRNQLTDPESKRKRNKLRYRTFRYYLKRWGNRYRAVYGYKDGYLVIRKLLRVRRMKRR
jgi:glycosyltransferase involved in cell wall biosynthesis